MSPRWRVPSRLMRRTPPKSCRASDRLMASSPNTDGAIEADQVQDRTEGDLANAGLIRIGDDHLLEQDVLGLDVDHIQEDVEDRRLLPPFRQGRTKMIPLMMARSPGLTLPHRSCSAKHIRRSGWTPDRNCSGVSWSSMNWVFVILESPRTNSNRVCPLRRLPPPRAGRTRGVR